MKFQKTEFKDVFTIKLNSNSDDRGSFTRIWDKSKFQKQNLIYKIVQTNFVLTRQKGTIRGLHYQNKPFQETKIVSCIKGKIFDVIIDLRKNSKTFQKYFSLILDSSVPYSLYIPKGFAHGYQTLSTNSCVLYQTSQYYNPDYEEGIRWNDPFFKINWPIKPTKISKKDQIWKNYESTI